MEIRNLINISSFYQLLKSLLQWVRVSLFFRNVAIVATGSAGVQIIVIIFSPIITRIYGPSEFGVLGTFLSIASIFISLSTLAYSLAIILPKAEEDAVGLTKLSILISIITTSIVSVFIWLYADWLVMKWGGTWESAGKYFIFIPIVMLFSGWLDIAKQWIIRKKEYSKAAFIAIANGFIAYSFMVSIGLFYPVAIVLILVTCIGYLMHALMIRLIVFSNINYSYSPRSDNSKLIFLVKKYSDFPIYRVPQNIINGLSQVFPVIMLSYFWGFESVGFYVIAKMVMGVPSVLVGKSVADVFYQKYMEYRHNRIDGFHLVVKATLGLFVVGLIPYSIIVIFGPWLFSFAFGHEWSKAGEYAQWLAPFFFLNFINKPAVAIVPALNIQKGLLFYELFSTLGKAVALVVGFYYFKNDVIAIALFSLSGVIFYVYMISWIIWEARKNEHREAGG